MRKQLKFELQKMKLQSVYGMVPLFSLLSSLGILTRSIMAKAPLRSVIVSDGGLFRIIFWFVCGYLICGIFSEEYHDKTLKTVLPLSRGRGVYLGAKALVATGYCAFTFLVFSLTKDILGRLLYSGARIDLIEEMALPFAGACLGVFVIVCLAGDHVDGKRSDDGRCRVRRDHFDGDTGERINHRLLCTHVLDQ